MRKLVILLGVLVGILGLFIAYSAQSQPVAVASAKLQTVINHF